MNKFIIAPNPQVVNKYLEKWDSLDNYVMQEKSLMKLFQKTYPCNNDIDDVLIKVCALNDFYSTNIFSPFSVAIHIVSIDIDNRMSNNDLRLVNDIAKVNIKGIQKNFYSFATKYCSHHYPKIFPIYDSYVEKMLLYFKNADHFMVFSKIDLKIYENYVEILKVFQKYYCLTEFNLK
ncbi:MAG: hypothetical protein GXX85_06095 [Ignavibacteria bacterium]|nr:hypothetical protein [Ignavibacteria bacterium]